MGTSCDRVAPVVTTIYKPSTMKTQVALILCGAVAIALARPGNDIVDFQTDHMEVEQEGVPGKAVEGEYSWTAPNAGEAEVKYTADVNGFRAVDYAFKTDDKEVKQEGVQGKAVEGEYRWTAPNAEEFFVKYTADHNGFRVVDTDATATFRDAGMPADVDGEGQAQA